MCSQNRDSIGSIFLYQLIRCQEMLPFENCMAIKRGLLHWIQITLHQEEFLNDSESKCCYSTAYLKTPHLLGTAGYTVGGSACVKLQFSHLYEVQSEGAFSNSAAPQDSQLV